MIVLASQSSGRLATLRAAGVEPLVRVSAVDESAVLTDLARGCVGDDAPTPTEQVAVLARAKAQDVAGRLTQAERREACAVVGCDSMLEIDGVVVGKPADAAQARERWLQMRGRTGVLHTGHHLVALGAAQDAPATLVEGRTERTGGAVPGAHAEGVSSTVVRFAQVDEAEIDAYVATGEPLWCAGAFTIDGLGGAFVEGVDGDPHGVVGISLPLLRRLLAGLGIRWTDLWGALPAGGRPGAVGTTASQAPSALEAPRQVTAVGT